MRKVALRGLFARRVRLALTALAVAVGTTFICATYVFTDTINASFDRIFTAAFANTDVVVTPNSAIAASAQGDDAPPLPASLVERVRQVDGVQAVDGSVFDANGAILKRNGDPTSSGAPNFIASIHDVERFRTFRVADGRLPTSADEVALDKSTADRFDFGVGKDVDIVGKAPKKTFRVVGVIRVAGVDSYGGASIALMTLPEAQRMAGKVGRFDQIDVAVASGTSAATVRDRIRALLPPGRYDVRTGQQQADKQTRDIKDTLSFLPTALLAFAGIALFVGAFLIFNTFSITVAQRAREFALLRTLGASRGQVLRSVLGEGALLGVSGSAAGLGLGILAAKGLRAAFKALGFDLPSQGTVLEQRTVVVVLVVGSVVTVIASLAPALRATRVPPVAALREGIALPETRSSRLAFPFGVLLGAIGVGLMAAGLFAVGDATSALSLVGAGAAVTFLGVALLSPKLVPPLAAAVGAPLERAFGTTGRLARENAVRQPGRTAVTASALMIGVTLVTFASIFAASAKSTVSFFIDTGLRGDAVVQNRNGFAAFSGEAAREVRGVDGVRVAAAVRFGRGKLPGAKDTTGVTGIDPTFVDVWNITSGQDVLRGLGDGDIAVAKEYADKHDVRPGQTLRFRTSRAITVPLTVRGIVEDKSRILGDFIVDTRVIDRQFGLTQDSYLFLGFDPGADGALVRKRIAAVLKRDYPQTEVLSADGFKSDQADQVDQLLGLIYALLALAILVAMFGIVNTLVLSITERTRELGMLRAIGTSRRQVKRMIRLESVITATIGSLIGTGLGILLGVLVSQAIDDFRLSIPAGPIVALVLLAALAGAIAAVLPARRAARLDVLRALSYE